MAHSRLKQLVLLAALPLVLIACGGGGSNPPPPPPPAPSPPPPPPNSAPTFTSAATVSVVENSSGTTYTATATDPNNDPLTFSITGGADSARFQITAAGALSFRAPPDFEAPTDADGNNVYVVDLRVSDGQANAQLTLSVTVTDSTAGAARLRLVASGFVGANNLVPVPGTTFVFVTERRGRVLLLNTTTGAVNATPFLDVSGEVSTDGRRGLLGFAPAPDFATSGTVYVSLTNPAGELEVRRYRILAGNPNQADPASADLILKAPAVDSFYVSGWIGFAPDGLLFVTVGNGPTPNSDIQSLLGKVLRIDITRDIYPADPERDYGIPLTNPGGNGRDEIYVRGFQAPRFATVDPVTGYLFVTDYGQPYLPGVHGDEINWVRPLHDVGFDYSPFSLRNCDDQNDPPAGTRLPIFCNELSNATPGGTPGQFEVVVGPVYRGPVESAQGKLFTGQQNRAQIDTVIISQIVQNEQQYGRVRSEPFRTFSAVNGFGVDAANNLYFLLPTGEIYIFEPA